jgi:hypothetical protein
MRACDRAVVSIFTLGDEKCRPVEMIHASVVLFLSEAFSVFRFLSASLNGIGTETQAGCKAL